MTEYFDGKKIRLEILSQLKAEVDKMKEKPFLRVFWVGDNEVSGRYVELKKKVAEEIGVECEITRFPTKISQDELIAEIKKANTDRGISGVMIQIPLPDHIDRIAVVEAIDPAKDIDGLRICGGFDSAFKPPVVMAILEAIKYSKIEIGRSKVVLVGQGFLVGKPLSNYLKDEVDDLTIIDQKIQDISNITSKADLIISATGVGEIIKPSMIKNGVVLIDAGTSEIGGKFIGDISSDCYQKSSYYTPTPGGIGPMTIAMLMRNLVNSKSV